MSSRLQESKPSHLAIRNNANKSPVFAFGLGLTARDNARELTSISYPIRQNIALCAMRTTTEGTYKLLDNQSLWQVAQLSHHNLAKEGIPHAILGGVAVCLHGYRRNTVDIDLLVRPSDSSKVSSVLEESGFQWHADKAEFLHSTGTPLYILLAGERAGKGSEITLPDPAEPNTVQMIEGLPVLTLARLIETKIASGEGNLRRTHKDFADVVELIANHELDGSFSRFIHKSVRSSFRKLVKHGRDDEKLA